jgi:hypothetical protein
MADEKTPSKFNFGIEKTTELSGEELFNSFETVSTSPEKVRKIDAAGGKQKPATKKGKKPEDEDEDVEEENIDDKGEEFVGENPGLLDLLDDEDTEEEEEENEKPKKDKEKAKPDTKAEGEANEETDDDDKGEVPDDESDNYFSSITSELFNLGVFTKDEDEDTPEVKTGEEFLNLFVNEKKKGAIAILEDILSRHGEDKRDLFDAIILKGVEPREYLQRYAQIEDLREVDMADEENQERVVREELKAQGWEREDIEAEVTKLKQYGDMEVASKRYQKSLIRRIENQFTAEKEKRDQEAEQAQAREQEYTKNITTILNAKLKEKEFDGIPLTPDMANRTFDFIHTKKWKLPSGETITDFDNEILRLQRPENHGLKVKIALLMNLLKTDPTLSSIQKRAVSKESNTLFSGLEKKKVKTENTPAKRTAAQVGSWFT